MPRKATKRKAKAPTLTLHKPTGQWSKCFSLPDGTRRTVYFGVDPDKAMTQYLRERDAWQAGQNPRELQRTTAAAGSLPLCDVVNAFLTRCSAKVQVGELSAVSFADYRFIGAAILEHFGRQRDPCDLGPRDFNGFRAAMAAKYAKARLSKTVVVTRSILKWAFDSELIDRMPRFGPDFKIATRKGKRAEKKAAGGKMLTAAELRAILKQADDTLKAMLYLGVNCGYGNTDLATLTVDAVDLAGGFVTFARQKTGIDRRCPLWPETIAALRKVLPQRKPRPEFAHLLFVTSRGGPWLSVKPDGKRVDQIIPLFREAAVAAGVHRPRMGLYWCRHVCQTIGDEARDPLATAHLMGHADGTIGGHYRETISDERLRRVTDHVRQWLHAKPVDKPTLRLHAG